MRRKCFKTAGFWVLITGWLFLAHAQLNFVDIEEKNILESVKYFFKDVEGNKDYSAEIYFEFKGSAGKYYHTKKGNKLILEFYDAAVQGQPLEDRIREPFSDVEMTTRREELQLMEEMESKMRDIIRFEFTVKKRFDIDYAVSGSHNLITLSTTWAKGKALSHEKTKEQSNIWKYVLAGAVVITAVVAVSYLVESTSDTETGQVYTK